MIYFRFLTWQGQTVKGAKKIEKNEKRQADKKIRETEKYFQNQTKNLHIKKKESLDNETKIFYKFPRRHFKKNAAISKHILKKQNIYISKWQSEIALKKFYTKKVVVEIERPSHQQTLYILYF